MKSLLTLTLLFVLTFPKAGFAQINLQQDSGFVFLNTNEISTTQNLFDHFKGKTIYIDFWATWCAPCLEEFQFHKTLQKLAEDHSVVLLHISLDREKHEKKWKKRINEYHLTGYHLRADWDLQKDMWNVIFQQETRPSIPRFVIVGKDGKILNNEASKPSEIELLKNEFDQIIDSK